MAISNDRESKSRTVPRREFLKIAAKSGIGLAALGVLGPLVEKASAQAIPEVVPAAQGVVAVDSSRCGGCERCVSVCSTAHEGVSSRALSRIKVNVDKIEGISQPQVCRQCYSPECVHVCPTGALHVDEVTGARVIDETKCAGCQMCAMACPFGAISYNPIKKVCFKCDLCGGDPECVKTCPNFALKYIPGENRFANLFR